MHTCTLFIKTCTYLCTISSTWFTAIVLLRKYHDVILDYFPDNHITTVGLLNGVVALREGFMDEIIACTDPREGNQRMLNAIVIILEHDRELVRACELVKALIGDKKYSKEFLEFETSKYFYDCSIKIYQYNECSIRVYYSQFVLCLCKCLN